MKRKYTSLASANGLHAKLLMKKILLIVVIGFISFVVTPRHSTAASAWQSGQPEDDATVVPLDGEAREQAAKLVRQLANPNFELRQEASRKLWKIGPPALNLLLNAADGGLNSEARMRAKELATLIRVGLEHDADADVVRCVVGFLDREAIVQDRAIQKLCHLQQVEVAQRLVNLVESENDRARMQKFCSMAASDAELALRLGEDKKFEKWVSAPTTRESQKLLFYYHLWIDNELEPEIDRLKREAAVEIKKAAEKKAAIEKEKAKQKLSKNRKSSDQKLANDTDVVSQPKLMTLIGLLRFLERWDESLQYADKVYDRKKRRQLTHAILMESGNWQGLIGLIVEAKRSEKRSEEDIEHNGLAYYAEGYRKALIEYYAGDETRYQATISKIEKGIEDEARKQKQRGNAPSEGDSTHAAFLNYTLDFDRARKYQPLKKNTSTFQVLSRLRRYELLLETFKLRTFDQRARYFKGRSRRIRSLQKRIEYYASQNDSGQQETYVDKRDAEIQNWLNVVGLLATLGFDEEAELYYRQMFFEFSKNANSISQQAIQKLQEMGACASAWEIAEIEANRSENFNCLAALLNPNGAEHDVAVFLDVELQRKLEDPIERWRKVATLIKSPMDLSDGEIDFWDEVATIDLTGGSGAVQRLFTIWNLDEGQLFRRVGNVSSIQLIEKMMKDGQYLLAAQKYEAMALANSQPRYYAQAWHAYKMHGDAAKAKRMRLLFVMNFDPDDAYDYTNGYAGTLWQSLPFDAYRLHDCLENTEVGSNCYYMWRIASNDTEAVLSGHQKMVRTQILRLNYIDSPYFEQSEKDHPRFIEGALASGDVDAARRWFRKLASFQPADSSFVEDNFPAIEKIGHKGFVDEMFDEVSKGFYRILKVYPDSAMYLNNYAWACACAKRNVKNGIELSKRAVELRPGTAGYFDTLAELYHVDGQHDLAIQSIRRAIEINPMRRYYMEQLKKFKEAKVDSAD